MWGPSIIGFGQYHYKYASGREGDSPAVAFSPRKASLVLYGLSDLLQAAPLLASLGKYRAGASCIYINKLADVDLAVLHRLLVLGHRHTAGAGPQPPQAP